MDCATKCKWNRRGKCVLFAGQSLLECKYRRAGAGRETTSAGDVPGSRKTGKHAKNRNSKKEN